MILSLMFSFAVVMAQERTVSGKVTTPDEGGLPGVNIFIQGTTIGTISDLDGSFKLTVPGPDAVLVFSSVGYVTQTITVGSQTVIDVVMESDVTALQEIVVTGYTTQRKKDLTGSVGVVAPEDLQQMPQGNIVNQMQGRVAGVNITQDSRPGETARVRVRGISSISGANDPLYIVDGVPVGNISHLNPNDVESISVLKDAGAASIYGSRASNGVIVVTTKKGKSGRVNVNYNMYYGVQNPGEGPIDDILDATEYGELQWLVLKSQNLTDPLSTLYATFNPANPGSPGAP
ncbi:MAG: TonB-dependent receptor plug domain-containing protein, partial [Synechococcaceae cyanobacterium]|nr:TonB-dependent receptor plug domain-containing protein [Synechococcaceae cyanobacterium]